MQEIKVTDTYKCPLCGEKLIEVRLDITLLVDFFEKMRNGRIFHLMNVEIAHLILQQRIAGKVF